VADLGQDGSRGNSQKSLMHHVEEEEGEMFPKIREVFDEDELEQLGQELESAKGTQHREAV
jgi:hemerythrin superfamily protein